MLQILDTLNFFPHICFSIFIEYQDIFCLWCWKWLLCLVTQSCPVLCNSVDCSPLGFSVHGDSPGKNTEPDCHALLQGILPTQGSNPGLPHCRWILNCLSYQRSSRILEWAAYPFSKGTSPPRDRTRVSCIAGRVFISWATQEALSFVEDRTFLFLEVTDSTRLW